MKDYFFLVLLRFLSIKTDEDALALFNKALQIYQSSLNILADKATFWLCCQLSQFLGNVQLAEKVYHATPDGSRQEAKANSLCVSFW